ncbi:hypothetical protein [Anaerosporobacter faecicola]|uniref:hypothetical protein n=1 Tax=Anaerosporobacter faecicola TaxID=2718714 RepID=UPI00143A1393|nr:hypothetical protein [Anaerosporobacter faecicola]
MKNNNLKIGIIVGILLLVSVIVYGFVWKLNCKDCGLAHVSTTEDLDHISVRLDYAFGMRAEEEKLLLKELKEGKTLIEEALQSDIIVVGKATGNIVQSNCSQGQEIIVEKVLTGQENISENSSCFVYGYFGFQEVEGQVIYMNPLNVMQPNEEYLLFLESSELNERQKKKSYYLTSDSLGYIALNNRTTPTIEREQMNEIEFSELKKYNFFSASTEVTEALITLQKEIITTLLR